MGFLKRLFSIMNKKQKIALVFLFFSMLLNAFLELIGVALISPVVTVLQAEGKSIELIKQAINRNFFSRWVVKIFHLPVTGSYDSLAWIITVMLIIVIAVYILKAGVFIFVNYLVSLYTHALSKSLSNKLIKAYLSMPYDYFVNTNSSIIIRKCTNDVNSFTSCINGIINSLVAFCTAIAVFAYLMVRSWVITIAITIVMALAAFISVFVIKRNIERRGRKVQNYSSKSIDILHRTIYGIKETKISRSEDFFAKQYYINADLKNKNMLIRSVLHKIPGVIVQNFGIIVLMLIMIVLVINKLLVPSEIVSLLTALVVAVVKLLPCINTISNNAVDFAYFKPAVNCIVKDLQESERINKIKKEREAKSDGKPIKFKEKIEVKNLSFKYKKSSVIIVENVNVLIKKGEYVAISGSSGAGKTTLVDNILGLLVPQKGDIQVDNKSIYDNIDSWHSLLAYVPQTIYLLDDTIKANVCFGLDVNEVKDKIIWDALEKAQLKKFVESLPDKLESKIGESGVRLSGGQRQRIGIARAFFRNTPIIVLDEATSALDYKTEETILDDIRRSKGNKTIIIITHRLNTISSCDKIYSIENHICKQIK